jgi:hypothetical protein
MNAVENHEQANRDGVAAIASMAALLIVLVTATLATTGLLASREPALAQGVDEPRIVRATSAQQVSQPARSFAFGSVEFDRDPTAPAGVPGFDSWPPASSR